MSIIEINEIHMKVSTTGQEKVELLIQVTA
jgi:hypothetical protein